MGRRIGRPRLTAAPSVGKNLLLPVAWVEFLSQRAHDERVSISTLIRTAVGEMYGLRLDAPASGSE